MMRIIKIFSYSILAIVILILAFVPVRLTHGTDDKDSGKPLIIGHRGASGVAPENTLPAIDSALAAGADYIEIDVHLSKDKALVVMHDESVCRTSDGKGDISEMTAEEIRKLDAGSWYSDLYIGTKVPFLEEIISHVNGRAKLLIEIKKKEGQYEGIEEAVIAVIREYQAESWCVVQSFNDEVLEIMHEKAPGIELHKLIVFKYRMIPYVFDGKITRFSMEKYKHVRAINMHFRFFNSSFSRMVHDKGKMIFLWGCRKEEPCFPLTMPGYDGIITDFPREFNSQLKQD